MQREDGLTKASEVAKLIADDLTGLTAWEIRNVLSQVLTAVSKHPNPACAQMFREARAALRKAQ
jgi:hypothetical protein